MVTQWRRWRSTESTLWQSEWTAAGWVRHWTSWHLQTSRLNLLNTRHSAVMMDFLSGQLTRDIHCYWLTDCVVKLYTMILVHQNIILLLYWEPYWVEMCRIIITQYWNQSCLWDNLKPTNSHQDFIVIYVLLLWCRMSLLVINSKVHIKHKIHIHTYKIHVNMYLLYIDICWNCACRIQSTDDELKDKVVQHVSR